MKNKLTVVTAAILVVIFLFMLFTFQVRQTQVAVVTTFGKFSREPVTEPSLYFRLPWPIHKVYKLENRIQTYEGKFEQTSTKDGYILMVSVYVGWRIDDPRVFLERFEAGSKERAEKSLENLVRDAQNSAIGAHFFGDLISANSEDLKFDQIESEMQASVSAKAKAEYGIEITTMGINRLGLPSEVTPAVFSRMISERQVQIDGLKGEGDREAEFIRADADRTRRQLISEAEAKATVIRGEADAVAAKSYKVFDQNPELALLILRLKALEQMMQGKTTLILDSSTEPLGLLRSSDSNK